MRASLSSSSIVSRARAASCLHLYFAHHWLPGPRQEEPKSALQPLHGNPAGYRGYGLSAALGREHDRHRDSL